MFNRTQRRSLLTLLSPYWALAGATLIATMTSFLDVAAQNPSFRPPNIVAATTAAQPPGTPNDYEPGDIYLPGSRVYVLVDKTGLGHQHGVMGQIKQGRIRLDLPQDSGQLSFDLTTFAADPDLARQYVGLSGTEDPSSQQQVTANMLGADVLNVAQFPTATFQIKRITQLPTPSQRGLTQYELDGDFSLHGATQPIRVIADAEQNGPWIHLRGGFSILQTQYGITPFSKAFGAVGVADQLQIYGDLWLSKDRQTATPSAAH